MQTITAILAVFSTDLSTATLLQFSQVLFAMLVMTGWVTLLNTGGIRFL